MFLTHALVALEGAAHECGGDLLVLELRWVKLEMILRKSDVPNVMAIL